jgi:cobalt-zinc-cadmium efflux system membrane fusion protein
MTYRSGVFTGVLYTLIALAAVGGAYWLAATTPAAAAKGPPPAAPATVPTKLNEEKINTVTLTPEALQRLALTTGQAETKPVRRTRVYGGEITVPAGQTIIVSAPITGTLKAPPGGLPQPGQQIKKAQALFQLVPLLTPESQATMAASRVDAEGQVKNAEATLKQAERAHDRAQKMFRDQAGSKRAVEEADRDLTIARETLKAAHDRVELLDRVLGSAKEGTAAPVTIDCPEEGMLQKLAALPGQQVPAGAVLFEVSRLEKVWVRVPVYVGDQPEIDAAADAEVGNLAARVDMTRHHARPVTAPP